MNKIRITIINRSRFAREGIVRLLDEDDRLDVCSHHGKVESALRSIFENAPDVVVIDLTDSKDINSIAGFRAVREDITVVVSGIPLSEGEVISCAKAGAAGYIRNEATGEEWADAICAAAQGYVADSAISGILNRYITRTAALGYSGNSADSQRSPWRIPQKIEESASRVGLTQRERQILSLVDQGLSTKHIARKLEVCPNTIKAHISSILAKYNVHRRSEAAALFRQTKESEAGGSGGSNFEKKYSRN